MIMLFAWSVICFFYTIFPIFKWPQGKGIPCCMHQYACTYSQGYLIPSHAMSLQQKSDNRIRLPHRISQDMRLICLFTIYTLRQSLFLTHIDYDISSIEDNSPQTKLSLTITPTLQPLTSLNGITKWHQRSACMPWPGKQRGDIMSPNIQDPKSAKTKWLQISPVVMPMKDTLGHLGQCKGY